MNIFPFIVILSRELCDGNLKNKPKPLIDKMLT